ncbi:hypothetical protein [Archangium violaceum]|uniref:Uncharacterized protein n=1 Tax=Archangium violaceum Cb vi76 TaxID=1406225 RepID=A0A084T008_9BACT|nr:hypothetical protein [Archangium violaceum]KFA94043.1 hypothetical protein Q664_05225 [Archangium violaceum Cb vi76]
MRRASASPARLELARAQGLYMRLLYCRQTVAAFSQEPERVLVAHGLGPGWRALLPDTRGEGHRAEMHGRRLRAGDELQGIYAETFYSLLSGAPEAEARWLSADWFSEFLSSEEFFDSRWSLPHPSGVGRGYEGCTRFFFWARRHFRLRERQADAALREALYLDFAAYLDELRRGARPRDYRRFARGLYWRREPGRVRHISVYTPDRQVLHTGGRAALEALRELGLADLDELEP